MGSAEASSNPKLEEIVSAINSNPKDPTYWELFVKHSWAYVYSCVRRLDLGKPDCDDIVQSVYLKVAILFDRKGNLPENREALFAYLKKTARHTTFDFLRQRGERLAHAELDTADSSQDTKAWVDLLDAFSPGDQRLILLIAVQRCTQTEAAERLGVSLRTVERRMALIRRIVKDLLSA